MQNRASSSLAVMKDSRWPPDQGQELAFGGVLRDAAAVGQLWAECPFDLHLLLLQVADQPHCYLCGNKFSLPSETNESHGACYWKGTLTTRQVR